MSAIVVAGAEKILAKSIDASVHAKMLDDLITEIKRD
jgi:F0F1-type ATP synthase membrane subunit b/b'